MTAHFNIPKLLRARRKAKTPEFVEFVPIRKIFKPQRRIVMLQDLSGWVNNDKTTGKKWHIPLAGRNGQANELLIDEDLADQFIIKGYARGELSREYSDDEILEIQSTVVNIGLGGPVNG